MQLKISNIEDNIGNTIKKEEGKKLIDLNINLKRKF